MKPSNDAPRRGDRSDWLPRFRPAAWERRQVAHAIDPDVLVKPTDRVRVVLRAGRGQLTIAEVARIANASVECVFRVMDDENPNTCQPEEMPHDRDR